MLAAQKAADNDNGKAGTPKPKELVEAITDAKP